MPNFSPKLDPSRQFILWYQHAVRSKVPMPDAMTLATATRTGIPSARIVLYKGMNPKGIRFFTNYRSRKAKELTANARAAVVFFWPQLQRQIRIEGRISLLSGAESDEYWNTRPRASRIGALASPQSSVIDNFRELEDRVRSLTRQFKDHAIPRPSHWGGFCLIPHRFEFWIGGEDRLHQRFCYTKKSGKRNGRWKMARLAP